MLAQCWDPLPIARVDRLAAVFRTIAAGGAVAREWIHTCTGGLEIVSCRCTNGMIWQAFRELGS